MLGCQRSVLLKGEAVSDKIAERIDQLRAKLEWECQHDLRWAKIGHFAFNVLLLVGITSSLLAGVLGLGWAVNTKTVAGIALIPAASTGALNQLRLQWRSMWHYRKRDHVAALLDRLNFGLSDPPTSQEVAKVAEDFSDLNIRMTLEWNKFFGTPIDAGPADTLEPRRGKPQRAIS